MATKERKRARRAKETMDKVTKEANHQRERRLVPIETKCSQVVPASLLRSVSSNEWIESSFQSMVGRALKDPE